MKNLRRFAALALTLVLLAAACTSSDDSEQVDTTGPTQSEINEAAFQELIVDPQTVVATVAGKDIRVQEVLDSLIESPPSQMRDPENPVISEFVARLTSMLRLRLTASALTDFGFEVDQSGSDLEINEGVVAVLGDEFENFARENSLEENPGLIKLASPHCVTLIATTTEEEAMDAHARLEAGESARDVAADLNWDGAIGTNGYIGCRTPTEWVSQLGPIGTTIGQTPAGQASVTLRLPTAGSPTGEQHGIIFIESVSDDEVNLESLGSFTGHVLSAQMMTYELSVAGELGRWEIDSLAITLPS